MTKTKPADKLEKKSNKKVKDLLLRNSLIILPYIDEIDRRMICDFSDDERKDLEFIGQRILNLSYYRRPPCLIEDMSELMAKTKLANELEIKDLISH